MLFHRRHLPLVWSSRRVVSTERHCSVSTILVASSYPSIGEFFDCHLFCGTGSLVRVLVTIDFTTLPLWPKKSDIYIRSKVLLLNYFFMIIDYHADDDYKQSLSRAERVCQPSSVVRCECIFWWFRDRPRSLYCAKCNLVNVICQSVILKSLRRQSSVTAGRLLAHVSSRFPFKANVLIVNTSFYGMYTLVLCWKNKKKKITQFYLVAAIDGGNSILYVDTYPSRCQYHQITFRNWFLIFEASNFTRQ